MNPGNRLDIPLVVVGCDFRTAAVRFRELLVTTPEDRESLFASLTNIESGIGFTALETCNRSEWIATTENPRWVAELLLAQIIQRWNRAMPDVSEFPIPYMYTGIEAVRHLLRVASGLESLAAGEAQIAGQFQDAIRRAQVEKTTTPLLNRLSNPAGRLAKSGYKIGFRSDHRVGIHGMAVDFLEKQLGTAQPAWKVAVVGMGSIGRKTAETLEEVDLFGVTRVNRTIKPEHSHAWVPIDGLAELAGQVDALVMSTGSLSPVLGTEHVKRSGSQGKLVVLDIGIPSQVHPEVQESPYVSYFNLDDLIELQGQNPNIPATTQMEEEIEKEVALYRRFCIERSIVSLLEETQQQRQKLYYDQIPATVSLEFSDLDEKTKRQIEAVMKQVIGDYASSSFNAIHKALEDYWSNGN